jgi:hypothetical protein
MKKIALFIALILTAYSCEDFLTVTPQDSRVADNYYIDEDALWANTASIYAGFPWFNFHVSFMWLAGDQLAGDIYYTYDQEGHFYYNQVGAGNSHNNNGFEGLYRVVSYANSIINDMPPAASQSGISQTSIDRALAEARFIRATAYYFLSEYWDEIPIIENSTALITSGNTQDIYVNKHTKSSIYRFICEDLEFAKNHLPPTPYKEGRVTEWSAKGLLAKVYLTRGTYEKNSEYFELAKNYAGDVIENSGLQLWPDYSTLFDIEANNNPESLFAVQCMMGGYALGNARNVSWARSARIADQQWGAGKGPTLSLQEAFKDEMDTPRRKTTFMTAGDKYPNLNKVNGGYSYQYSYRTPDDLDTQEESPNEVLAHIKKYVIGKASDSKVGSEQDAGNNLYILRLADVYLVYAEACMGLGGIDVATDDKTAIKYLDLVRERAGVVKWNKSSITFQELINERRKEFAFEGINWFDIKRIAYRNEQAVVNYLNNMQRDRIYRRNYDKVTADYGDVFDELPTNVKYEIENNLSYYFKSWQTVIDNEHPDANGEDRAAPITFTTANLRMPLPSAVTTKAPILNEPAVDYYTNK